MDYTILVNKDNLLDSDYIPEDMVEINEPTGSKIDKTYVNKLNKEAYASFKLMQAEALKYGYEIFIDSSYRSYDYQVRVFDATQEQKGLEHTFKAVALPGASEHQTGLAIDIIFRRNGEMIEEQKETDPEIEWLFANSYKFGYILRYPKGKEDITGFNFEPWHFRYVGLELAQELHDNSLTLEEHYSLKKRLH
jgi:D-alanyl-D-alanine carboxypeptidase